MKTESGRTFLCGSVEVYFTNLVLVARKPTFLHHLLGKQNYQALFVNRSDFGGNLFIFCPNLLIILQFLENNLTIQITLIQCSGRSKHALTLPQQIISKMTTT